MASIYNFNIYMLALFFMTFKISYFLIFLFILIIEISIAAFLKTGFIRHTFGDFLVVILLYCFFQSFCNATPLKVGLIVLIIAFMVEILQLSPFLELLNLENNQIAKIIFGSTFHISDLLAYTFGMASVLFIEYKLKK